SSRAAQVSEAPPRLPGLVPTFRRLPSEIWEGIRWMVAHPFIRATCVLIGLLQLAYVALSLLLVALAARMGAGAATIGRVLAAGGAGGLVGALVGPAIERRFGPAQVAVICAWVAALLAPLFLLADRPLTLGLVYALLCAVLPILSVAVVSH